MPVAGCLCKALRSSTLCRTRRQVSELKELVDSLGDSPEKRRQAFGPFGQVAGYGLGKKVFETGILGLKRLCKVGSRTSVRCFLTTLGTGAKD